MVFLQMGPPLDHPAYKVLVLQVSKNRIPPLYPHTHNSPALKKTQLA
jgi:hypothetical protein